MTARGRTFWALLRLNLSTASVRLRGRESAVIRKGDRDVLTDQIHWFWNKCPFSGWAPLVWKVVVELGCVYAPRYACTDENRFQNTCYNRYSCSFFIQMYLQPNQCPNFLKLFVPMLVQLLFDVAMHLQCTTNITVSVANAAYRYLRVHFWLLHSGPYFAALA